METITKFFKEEKDYLFRKGEAKGIEKGLEQGLEQKSYEVVENLLSAGKFTIAEIANFATVTEEFVEKVRLNLAKKK